MLKFLSFLTISVVLFSCLGSVDVKNEKTKKTPSLYLTDTCILKLDENIDKHTLQIQDWLSSLSDTLKTQIEKQKATVLIEVYLLDTVTYASMNYFEDYVDRISSILHMVLGRRNYVPKAIIARRYIRKESGFCYLNLKLHPFDCNSL